MPQLLRAQLSQVQLPTRRVVLTRAFSYSQQSPSSFAALPQYHSFLVDLLHPVLTSRSVQISLAPSCLGGASTVVCCFLPVLFVLISLSLHRPVAHAVPQWHLESTKSRESSVKQSRTISRTRSQTTKSTQKQLKHFRRWMSRPTLDRRQLLPMRIQLKRPR